MARSEYLKETFEMLTCQCHLISELLCGMRPCANISEYLIIQLKQTLIN